MLFAAIALIVIALLLGLIASPVFLALAVVGIALLVYAWRAADRRAPEPH